MGEGDTDWERAHLRMEENGVEERDEDCLRAHLRVERNGVEEGEICDLGESALDMVGMVWGREIPTWRERT